MTSLAEGRRPFANAVSWAERHSEALATAALGLLMALAAVVLYRKGLGLTFYYDEWSIVIERRGWDLDTFLEPHNEHIALLPIAVFKLLFVIAGLDDYWIYRVVAIGAHLLCVALLFVLLRRRVGAWAALGGSSLLLFLGTAWEDLLWPFQIGFVGSVAAGLGMLLALERRDRLGDVSAAVMLGVSLACSSIGLPFVAASAVEVLLRPRRFPGLWIPLAPLALWGVWYLVYGKDGVLQGTTLGAPALLKQNVPGAPTYVAEMLASGLGALLGLGVEWGRPLALIAIVAIALLLARSMSRSPRFLSLLAAAAAYFGLTAAFRGHLKSAAGSRYTYFTAVLVLLLAAELLRGRVITRRALAVLSVIVVAAGVSNFAKLREGSLYLQDVSGHVATELGALEVAGEGVDPGFRPDPVRAPPISAAPYFDAVEDLDSPADSPGEILRRPEQMRQAADAVLVQALRIGPFRGGSSTDGSPPQVTAAEGEVQQRGPCAVFRPAGAPSSVEVDASSDLLIRNHGTADAEYRLRSFADTHPAVAQGTLAAGSTQTLPLGRGEPPRPWRLKVTAYGPVDLCSSA